MTVRTVLVVDDDDDIRQLAQMALELTAGWTVLTANGGAAAIEHGPGAPPGRRPPRHDDARHGRAHHLRPLQSDEATRDIPVILFTAKIQVGEQQAWDDYAIQGRIPKPFDPMTLADQVAQMLSWTSVELTQSLLENSHALVRAFRAGLQR